MNSDCALLQLMALPTVGQKKLLKLLLRLQSEEYPLTDFVIASESELREKYQFTDAMIGSLKQSEYETEEQIEELYRENIKIESVLSERFPKRLIDILGENCPPLMFLRGDIGIIESRSVGFCGSRKATESGIKVASQLAAELSKRDVNIVSGYASGVDMAAHLAALEVGGVTSMVLPIGILQFQLRAVLCDLISDDNCLILSEFPPHLGWVSYNAMHRNRLICALSDLTLVVEAELKGGTVETGKTALKLNRPLYVVDNMLADSNAEGNYLLIKRGGRRLIVDEDIDNAVAQLEGGISQSKIPCSQQTLFD